MSDRDEHERADDDDRDEPPHSGDDDGAEAPPAAEPPAEEKGPMRAAILSVVAAALCLAIGAFATFGVKSGIGVAIGGALAVANLMVFARLGQAFVAGKGSSAPWGIVAVLKLVALFGGVWLILKSGYVSGLALAVGYGALPIGITIGSLFGPRPSEPPENRDEHRKDFSRQTRNAQSRRDVVKGRRDRDR